MRKHKSCGLDYVRVSENCVASGDEGGTFMAPWERWEARLNPWLGRFRGSFGDYFVGCMHEFGSWGLTLRGAIDSFCMGEVCSWFGFAS